MQQTLSFLVVCGALAGCAPEPAAVAPSETLARARAEAEAARRAAEQGNAREYAIASYARAREHFEEASAIDRTDAVRGSDRAASRYLNAARHFRTASRRARENRPKFEAASTLEATYRERRAVAERLDAARFDGESWREAERGFREGRALLKLGEPTKASQTLTLALRDLDDAIEESVRKHALHRKTDELDRELAEVAARVNGAGLAAPHAERFLREARRALEEDDFDTAIPLLEAAERVYRDTLELGRAETVSPSATQPTPAPRLEATPLPATPPKLDLVTELARFFAVTPDDADGLVGFAYTARDPFPRDCDVLRGRRFVTFEGRSTVGVADYVFAANTTGELLHRAVFEDHVILEAEVLFQLVLPDDPEFLVVVMANEDGHYASNFGTDLRTYERKRVPRRIPPTVVEYRKHPTRWLQTREPVHIQMEYRITSDDDAGELSVSFNDREVCRWTTNKYRRGRVGFTWHNVKFVVKNLTVRGRVSEDWAREAIAGKPPKRALRHRFAIGVDEAPVPLIEAGAQVGKAGKGRT